MKEASKIYEKKVDSLIEKIQNEKNKIKRFYYIIRCKELIIMIEKQKDLEQAKKEFEQEKEKNKDTAKKERIDVRTKIIKINNKIEELELQLSENR